MTPSFLVPSSSVASFPSSLRPPAPIGSPMTPVCALAPFVGMQPQVPSLASSVASSFSVASLLSSAFGTSPFLPPSTAASPASFLRVPVSSSIFLLSRLLLQPLSSPGLCQQSLRVQLLLFLPFRLLLLLLFLLISRWKTLRFLFPLFRLLLSSHQLPAFLLLYLPLPLAF